MNKILKYKKLLMLLLVAGLFSCKQQLEDVIPQTALNRELILKDENAARTLYTGIYSSFRTYNAMLFNLGEMRSEIWADGLFLESADVALRDFYTHNVSVDNVPASNWGGFYGMLFRINTVIELFPQTKIPETERNRMIAEMHGLRAFIYYTMLRTWGGVPITTEALTQVGDLAVLYKERATPEEVMALVKSDIEQSLSLFNGNNSLTTKRVYWNRLATLTLKGDVYIWSGTLMGGGNNDLNIAKQALETVTALEGNTLGLNTNYADTFDQTKENNNKEIIFAINYELSQEENKVFNLFLINATAASTTLLDAGTALSKPVSEAFPLITGAGSRVGMTTQIMQKLNVSSDTRIRSSFRVMQKNTSPYAPVGVLVNKFIGRVENGLRIYDGDFPIYRYADVLLLLAEAKAKLLENPSSEINKIRQRAYGSGYLPHSNGSINQNIEAILEEQLREFIAEGKRWWALRRAGDDWVFKYINPLYLSPGAEYKFLLPISRASLNADPKLKQTPGYN